MQLTTFACGLLVALTAVVTASPTPEASYLATHDEILHWIKTTDADLTFVGAPINPLTPRAAQNTMVVYCSKRSQNVCGGSCTVYNGGAACLEASGTNCLSATHNVAFCDRGKCGGSCNQFSSCGTRLDNNFCYTPGTKSIVVGTA
ncbi:hypothetical protein C8Q74DRAFT_1371560 [Fomes fomentarius]|nr:hypothetical protein C8Q74DRAFT_1318979 [Fomes fomentarius]KAI0762541.1 hypothetical protein C8Q74DRAFT_1371560 [Fomes fomentarius]